MCTLLGCSREESIGLNYVDLMEPENAEEMFAGFNNIFTTGLSRKKNKVDFMYYDDLDINRVEKKGKYFYLYSDSQYTLKHSNNKVTIYDIVDSKRTLFKLSLKNADIKLIDYLFLLLSLYVVWRR